MKTKSSPVCNYEIASIRCGGSSYLRKKIRDVSYDEFLLCLPKVKENGKDLLDCIKSFYNSNRAISVDVYRDSRRDVDRLGSLHYLDVRNVVPDYSITGRIVKFMVTLNQTIYKISGGECNYNPGFSEFKVDREYEITSLSISTPKGYRNFVSCSTYDFEMFTSAGRHFLVRGFRKLYDDIVDWLGDKVTEENIEELKDVIWKSALLLPDLCTIFSDIEKDLPTVEGKSGINCVDIMITGGYGTTKRSYEPEFVGLSRRYSVNIPTLDQMDDLDVDNIENDYMLTYIY